jgi:phospho-N-acetylmuramoyl-pentapeptide-transferase
MNTMSDIVKIFAPATFAFIIGIAITPIVTYYLFHFNVWKKAPGKQALDGTEATEFNKIHKADEEQTPRMGGIVIWMSVLLTTIAFWAIAFLFPLSPLATVDFVSRSQTWIPFFTLILGALVGFLNDVYDVRDKGKGIRLRTRLLFVALLALAIGSWFYIKLDVVSVGLPYDGELFLGPLIVPFFMFLALSLYASGVIDGIDGLSGGVFATIFAAYSVIAFSQQQFDLAAFCATVAGAILAFLWFNIPPARFWMTETGTMALTLTLAVVVFMSDNLGTGHGIAVLPIIGFPLVATVLSDVIQITAKKLWGRKVFRIAPLHHHFEALGWPGYKVTMRYWVISIVCAIVGMTIAITA